MQRVQKRLVRALRLFLPDDVGRAHERREREVVRKAGKQIFEFFCGGAVARRGARVHVQRLGPFALVDIVHEHVQMPARDPFAHCGTDDLFVSVENFRALDRHVQITVVHRFHFDGNLDAVRFVFAFAEAGHTEHGVLSRFFVLVCIIAKYAKKFK